jgi:hypothetical protein
MLLVVPAYMVRVGQTMCTPYSVAYRYMDISLLNIPYIYISEMVLANFIYGLIASQSSVLSSSMPVVTFCAFLIPLLYTYIRTYGMYTANGQLSLQRMI